MANMLPKYFFTYDVIWLSATVASAQMYVASVYTESAMIAIICEDLALLLSEASSHRAGAGARDCSLYSATVCV